MADAPVSIGESETSPKANQQGKDCTIGTFITEADGWKIIAAAASWEGTPYRSAGAGSVKGVGGDCSGTTNKSYVAAGFPYPYKMTSTFAAYANESHQFRQISPDKTPLQAGDLLLWPGHMAIYAPFPEGDPRRDTGVMHHGQKRFNDMYTAHNEHTNAPYGPYNIETFRGDPYKVYRYLVLPSANDCKK
jgi:hypothetical protein